MNKALLSILLLFILQSAFAQTKKITGFYEKNVEGELNFESTFDKNLSKENIGENIKRLSSKPHHIGSPGSKENAEYVLSQFKKFGWDATLKPFTCCFQHQNQDYWK